MATASRMRPLRPWMTTSQSPCARPCSLAASIACFWVRNVPSGSPCSCLNVHAPSYGTTWIQCARVEGLHGLLSDLAAGGWVLSGHDVVVDDRERLPGRPALQLAPGFAHPVFEQPRRLVGEPRL